MMGGCTRDSFLSQPHFNLDILLPRPKGLLFTILCNEDMTFGEIKEALWSQVRLSMDFHGEPSQYCLEGVDENAVIEKYTDDEMQISDTNMFCPLLKLMEYKNTDSNKVLIAEISMLIGKNVCDELFKVLYNEIRDYKKTMEQIKNNVTAVRECGGVLNYCKQKYPLRLELERVRSGVLEHEQNYNTMQYTVWFSTYYRLGATDKRHEEKTFLVPFQCTVSLLISMVTHIERLAVEKYIVKVSGRTEYFFKTDVILPAYTYVAQCICANIKPVLVLQRFNELPSLPVNMKSGSEKCLDLFSIKPVHPSPQDTQSDQCISVSQCTEYFSLTIGSLSGLPPEKGYLVVIHVAIYLGTQRLFQVTTAEKAISSYINWDQNLLFELPTYDVPRGAKICISIQKKKKDDKKSSVSIFWLNISVYDHSSLLRQGEYKRHVWPEGSELKSFHETGTLMPYDLSDTPELVVKFEDKKTKVCFPTLLELKHFAVAARGEGSLNAIQQYKPNPEDWERVQMLMNKPYGSVTAKDFTLKERNEVWKFRLHCARMLPHCLPRFLDVVNWECLDDVSQVYYMMMEWKPVSVATALQLLSPHIGDPHIREFAVYCLDKILDDEFLEHYLLQLVEAVKHELYIDSALSRFLLKRSLNNHVIGHYFYWHLRSQVASTEHGLQFGLMLEFYLKSCGPHLEELSDMSSAIAKLASAYDKTLRDKNKDPEEYIKHILRTATYGKALSDFVAPIDPYIQLNDMAVENTKIFDSKMRPVKATFNNKDTTIANREVIFMYKRGDDLRQDQLVHQFIQLVNKFWLDEGLDMSIVSYNVVCTDYKTGIIEIVQHSATLSSLIVKYNSMGILVRWLREKNPHPTDYEEARTNFVQSCCGYTLIHYVLGIADRHPSNIMLTQDGKLFHIDYGHILGNKKQKFGVTREPAPFIFIQEFVDFISDNKGVNSEEFKRFEYQFVKAYLILRKHTELFLTLLHLMLNAGLRELSSPDHIEYFEKAICLGSSEEQAERHILEMLHSSIKLSSSTQWQWLPHILHRKI